LGAGTKKRQARIEPGGRRSEISTPFGSREKKKKNHSRNYLKKKVKNIGTYVKSKCPAKGR